jgi:diguanylate cyclase (GGDEF)-like protein
MTPSSDWNARAAEKLVRYEALFDMLGALATTENIEVIVDHVAKRWKYFSNILCWRLVVDHTNGWLLIDGIRGKATIESRAALSDWDAHHWLSQRPMAIDPRHLPDGPSPPAHITLPGIVEVIILPVFRETQCIGLFTLGAHREPFGELDKKFNRMFCAQFADRVVGLMERREAERQLYERATTDALTGLFNRGTILDQLTRQLALARRCAQPISVLMADIDHFKAINDRFGHIVGDQVLRSVANRLREVARDGDSIGRYGGEEFLFVLYPCTADEVRYAAERFLQAVNRAPVALPGANIEAIPVTMSMGAMTSDTHVDIGLDMLLSRADAALYRAKLDGRDRFTMAA